MIKTIILVDSIYDLQSLDSSQLKSSNSKVYSFNIQIHKLLEKKGIQHQIAESYLSDNDQFKVFDTSVSCWNWSSTKPIFKELEFENMNLLDVLDTSELHHLILPELYNFLAIKRILEKENPQKIIAANHFSTMVNSLIHDKRIDLETIHAKSQKFVMPWNRFLIRFNIGKIPISFELSRSTYNNIRNLVESIVGTTFKLWFDFKNKKKSILFLEFDPTQYSDLLHHLCKYDKNIIFLNRRKSAIWNSKSVKILRKNKCKLISPEKILSSSEKNQISTLVDNYSKKVKQILSDDDNFFDLFSIENYSFWLSIKDVLLTIYKKRMEEYIKLVLFVKKLFEKIDVSCIISLNVIGETEKAVLEMNKKNIPSVLLEHGYNNYLPEISRFDIISMYPIFQDKIALWGEIQKNYLVAHRKIPENKIIVSGSPRHDCFFKREILFKTRSKKTILITPQNLVEVNGQINTNTYLRMENLLKRIFDITKKLSNVQVIVKLHPSQDRGTEYIKKVIHKLDSNVKIHQLTPIMEVIESCDMILNIFTEISFSTVVLEGLILKKPIMNVTVTDQIYELDAIKDKAVISISDKSDIEKPLRDILYNAEFRNQLIKNGTKHVKKYLVNPGKASDNLATILNSF